MQNISTCLFLERFYRLSPSFCSILVNRVTQCPLRVKGVILNYNWKITVSKSTAEFKEGEKGPYFAQKWDRFPLGTFIIRNMWRWPCSSLIYPNFWVGCIQIATDVGVHISRTSAFIESQGYVGCRVNRSHLSQMWWTSHLRQRGKIKAPQWPFNTAFHQRYYVRSILRSFVSLKFTVAFPNCAWFFI